MKQQALKMDWDDWQKQREALRAISKKYAPDGLRRTSSSSDARLKRLFNGERGPEQIKTKGVV